MKQIIRARNCCSPPQKQPIYTAATCDSLFSTFLICSLLLAHSAPFSLLLFCLILSLSRFCFVFFFRPPFFFSDHSPMTIMCVSLVNFVFCLRFPYTHAHSHILLFATHCQRAFTLNRFDCVTVSNSFRSTMLCDHDRPSLDCRKHSFVLYADRYYCIRCINVNKCVSRRNK